MINADTQNQIYDGEIWQATNCLQHERNTITRIAKVLRKLGYSPLSKSTYTDDRVWLRGNKRVVLCLVDDIRSCSDDYHVDLPYLFDTNTTVITDNQLTCPSIFRVARLPISFYGIYNYVPSQSVWSPKKDFAFQVNRIDERRCQLMIDLSWRTRLDSGHINFNCIDRYNQHLEPQEAFSRLIPNLGLDEQKYISAYEKILPMMPFKNYSIDFDNVPYQVWINLIVETYSSDNVISVSEKIFRALVTPAPWTVYSGRYTVAYFESLGFDCMSDIINHNHYDQLKEVEDKLKIFNWISLEFVKSLKEIGVEAIQQRCLQASKHNQQILADMSQQWPADFSNYLDTLTKQLAR
jgi:hypothetical protein